MNIKLPNFTQLFLNLRKYFDIYRKREVYLKLKYQGGMICGGGNVNVWEKWAECTEMPTRYYYWIPHLKDILPHTSRVVQ